MLNIGNLEKPIATPSEGAISRAALFSRPVKLINVVIFARDANVIQVREDILPIPLSFRQ